MFAFKVTLFEISILGGSVPVASDPRGSGGNKSLDTAQHSSPQSLCLHHTYLPTRQGPAQGPVHRWAEHQGRGSQAFLLQRLGCF